MIFLYNVKTSATVSICVDHFEYTIFNLTREEVCTRELSFYF